MTEALVAARVTNAGVFWWHWFASDWHWAILLACLTLLLGFGVVGVVIEDDGDWWIF